MFFSSSLLHSNDRSKSPQTHDDFEEAAPSPSIEGRASSYRSETRKSPESPSDAGWEEEVGTPDKEGDFATETKSALKSCFSAKKSKKGVEMPGSATKTVNFGSPDVREFDFKAPTSEQKPVSRDAAISMGYGFLSQTHLHCFGSVLSLHVLVVALLSVLLVFVLLTICCNSYLFCFPPSATPQLHASFSRKHERRKYPERSVCLE